MAYLEGFRRLSDYNEASLSKYCRNQGSRWIQGLEDDNTHTMP